MLVANDVDNHVIDPWSPLVDRRARRAKSDRIDAEGMLRALMAYARGERRVFAVVRVMAPRQRRASPSTCVPWSAP